MKLLKDEICWACRIGTRESRLGRTQGTLPPMYVRSLHVQHVKLLRDVKVDFVGRDGRPRMWTVFVGENRLCKTTLLQTIAAAASGVGWPMRLRSAASADTSSGTRSNTGTPRHNRRSYANV